MLSWKIQRRYQLYIPLCLYFNQCPAPCSQLPAHLYIPLCLYFNLCIVAFASLNVILYIPLCLYFNPLGTVSAHIFNNFTFHYVSILIIVLERMAIHIIVLYIPLCLYFNIYRMYGEDDSRALYIPLCLYFNWELKGSRKGGWLLYIPLCLYFNSTCEEFSYMTSFTLHSIMSLF